MHVALNLGRRRGDGVTYRRGQGTVEQELEKLQSAVEYIDPRVCDLEADVRELRTDRDSAKGLLKGIAVLQVLIIGLLIALFSWGLNHMTFHSDWERPYHSENAPQNALQLGEQSKEVQAPIELKGK
jgi:hypothetical protein